MNVHPLEINLMQLAEKNQTTSILLKPLLLAVLLLGGAGTVGWLWYDAASAKEQTKTQLANVNATIAKLQEARTTIASSTDSAALSLLLTLPDVLKLARPEMTGMLERIGDLLPRNANLTSIDYTDGGKIVVNARFASMEDIVTFMREAKSSPSFRNVRITHNTGSSEGSKLASPDETNPRQFRTPVPSGELSGKVQTGWTVNFEFEYNPAPAAGQGGMG